MQQYLDLLQHILDHGNTKADRTGIGTKSIFGYQMRFDLTQWFPLLTTKKVYLKAIIHELLRFLSGDTNIKYLVDHDVKIWNEWAYAIYLKHTGQESDYPRYSPAWTEKLQEFVSNIKNDSAFAQQRWDLWPVYGKQWRAWTWSNQQVYDQISDVIDQLTHNPHSRRILVNGRNVGEIMKLIKDPDAAPPPCHTLFQFYVADGKLSCQLYQRSADVFLWVPFNIASYALLTMMVAQVCDLWLGDFVHTLGDAHIYLNHLDQVDQQLSRSSRPLPTMTLNPDVHNIFDFTYEDFSLTGYDPRPAIPAPIAV